MLRSIASHERPNEAQIEADEIYMLFNRKYDINIIYIIVKNVAEGQT